MTAFAFRRSLTPLREVARNGVLAVVFAATGSQAAYAYDAQLAWAPVEGASGYKIYVSPVPGNPIAATVAAASMAAPAPSDPVAVPLDAGRLDVDPDGLIRFVLEDLPASPASSFAVSAYDQHGNESARSNVLVLTETTVARVVATDAVAEQAE